MKIDTFFHSCLAQYQHPTGLLISILTIHLSLVRQDDLSSSTWWVDGERFLKALLNVWTPDSLSVRRGHVLVVL